MIPTMPIRCFLLLVISVTSSVGRDVSGDDAIVPADRLPAWVDARVAEWQPKPSERTFDQIGWATEIRQAERLARRSGRPVFLFTHDGRIAIGRC